MKQKSLLYLISLSCFIFWSVSTWAQNNLELTINTDKDHYLLAEPVVVYTELKNIGSESVKVLRFLEPDYGFVRYYITRPDGQEEAFYSLMLKEHESPEQSLPSQSSNKAMSKIFFGSNGWTFDEEGSYLIRAVYLNQVASDTIVITVHRPANEEERKASRIILESNEVGFFMTFEGGDHLIDGMERLQEITTEFSKTSFSSYANYALGVNFANDFADFEKNRVRKADPQKAIQYLEKVKEKPLGLYHMVNTYTLLSDAYEKVGKTEKAKSAMQELKQVITKSPAAIRAWGEDYLKVRKIER